MESEAEASVPWRVMKEEAPRACGWPPGGYLTDESVAGPPPRRLRSVLRESGGGGASGRDGSCVVVLGGSVWLAVGPPYDRSTSPSVQAFFPGPTFLNGP